MNNPDHLPQRYVRARVNDKSYSILVVRETNERLMGYAVNQDGTKIERRWRDIDGQDKVAHEVVIFGPMSIQYEQRLSRTYCKLEKVS